MSKTDTTAVIASNNVIGTRILKQEYAEDEKKFKELCDKVKKNWFSNSEIILEPKLFVMELGDEVAVEMSIPIYDFEDLNKNSPLYWLKVGPIFEDEMIGHALYLTANAVATSHSKGQSHGLKQAVDKISKNLASVIGVKL